MRVMGLRSISLISAYLFVFVVDDFWTMLYGWILGFLAGHNCTVCHLHPLPTSIHTRVSTPRHQTVRRTHARTRHLLNSSHSHPTLATHTHTHPRTAPPAIRPPAHGDWSILGETAVISVDLRRCDYEDSAASRFAKSAWSPSRSLTQHS